MRETIDTKRRLQIRWDGRPWETATAGFLKEATELVAEGRVEEGLKSATRLFRETYGPNEPQPSFRAVTEVRTVTQLGAFLPIDD